MEGWMVVEVGMDGWWVDGGRDGGWMDGGWRDGWMVDGGMLARWLLVSQTPHSSLCHGRGIWALGISLQAALPHAHVISGGGGWMPWGGDT